MGRRERFFLRLWVASVLVGNGFALAVAVVLQNILVWLVVLGVVCFDLYWVYVRAVRRRRPRYPMVPPEGRADVYFPSSNVPRPVVAEARRFEEERKRFRKLRRRLRRVERKKA